MARNAIRAARPLGWMAVGAGLAALVILGPRVALNRGLDAGYSLAGWVSSFF
ncbi:MAG: hypothetical protein M3Q57_02205 [Pseudomonadota bacterium]|nr:hypothetical protein [Pseudomonadota bacterium]